jgi:hypothetical protein
MTNPWTPERRARQAEAIRRWRPWDKSTGPRTVDGKAIVSRNAFKGGMRPLLRQHIREARSQIAAAVAILDYCEAIGVTD